MGKKSKRRGGNSSQTNQNRTRGISTANTKDEFKRIERAVKSLFEDSCEMNRKFLFSQAHAKMSELASLLEANKDMLIKNHLDYYRITNVHAYEKIAHLEVKRSNFQAVIPIYEFCNSNAIIMTDKLYVMYCLALMVKGKKDSYQASEAALKYAEHTQLWTSDPSKHCFIPRKDRLAELGLYWNFFLVELRRMRKWDEALDFTNKFGMYIEESKLLSSDCLYVASYIERYRVEARKRPKDERNKMSVSLYKYIFARIGDDWAKLCMRKVLRHPYRMLLHAQWAYLNHQGTIEQNVKELDTAIFLVGNYIKAQYEDTVMYHCLGCEQKSTPSNSFLVCSGCRVACFCCVDHQRSSWKKELYWGVGIGHKILCPLYKAYHKCKNAEKSHGKNIDEYQLRFIRECETFLSDGLGLRDLCFSQDFVDKNGEEFRCGKKFSWRKTHVIPSGF